MCVYISRSRFVRSFVRKSEFSFSHRSSGHKFPRFGQKRVYLITLGPRCQSYDPLPSNRVIRSNKPIRECEENLSLPSSYTSRPITRGKYEMAIRYKSKSGPLHPILLLSTVRRSTTIARKKNLLLLFFFFLLYRYFNSIDRLDLFLFSSQRIE